MRLAEKLKEILSHPFSRIQIMGKFTLAYVITIVVPSLLMGYFSYTQSRNNVMDGVLKESRYTWNRMLETFDAKIQYVRNTCDSVAYKPSILKFMAQEWDFTPDFLTEYTGQILPAIEQSYSYKNNEIYKLCIYTGNHSIPEKWGVLFHLDKIEDQSWYRQLLADSQNDSLWFGPHAEDLIEVKNKNTNQVYSFAKEIYSHSGKYLGVVVVDILESDLFEPLQHFASDSQSMYVLDRKNRVLRGADAMTGTVQPDQFQSLYFHPGKDNFIEKGELYFYKVIEPLQMTLVSKVPFERLIERSFSTDRNMLLVVILGILILEVFTFYFLKNIFSRLRRIVRVMDSVSQGELDLRVPTYGNDEITQLSRDFNGLIDKINDLIVDLVKKETAKKDIQIKALQYQINPHFIYNTIDVFRMKLQLMGQQSAAETLADFGEILRYNMKSTSVYTTVSQEVLNLNRYLHVQKVKYEDRIHLEIRHPAAIRNERMLKFVLQPIVENSIKHGFGDRLAQLHIEVEFEKKRHFNEDVLEITVSDNGVGINPRQLDSLNHQMKYSEYRDENDTDAIGIGLSNINDRLKLFYGNEYYLKIESVLGTYTRILIRIPCQ